MSPTQLGKAFFKSRTLWVNILTLVVALLTAAAGNEWVATHAEVLQVLLGASAVANVLLRLLTSVPVGLVDRYHDVGRLGDDPRIRS